MLVAATSASAYYEHWESWWFSSFTFYHGSCAFNLQARNAFICDSTVSTLDSIYVPGDSLAARVICSNPGCTDTLYYYMAMDDIIVAKPTGRSDIKYADGTFTGAVYVTSDRGWHTIGGDLDGTFNYTESPYQWYGAAIITSSSPSGVTGGGSGGGGIAHYSTLSPCAECD